MFNVYVTVCSEIVPSVHPYCFAPLAHVESYYYTSAREIIVMDMGKIVSSQEICVSYDI